MRESLREMEILAARSIADLGAIEAAHGAWSACTGCTVEQCSDAHDRIASELRALSEKLSDFLSREEGKTRPEGIGEVARARRMFIFFAGGALRLTGDLIPSISMGVNVQVTLEPEGVVAIITPWGFPSRSPRGKSHPRWRMETRWYPSRRTLSLVTSGSWQKLSS